MQHEQLKDFQNTLSISNKNFGIQLSIIFFIIFLIRLYFNFFNITEIILITLSVFFIIISLYKPSILNPIRIIFSTLTKILFRLINPIIMLIFYILIFVPFGFVLKIFQYDPLREKDNKKIKTYWNFSNNSKKKFFKQQF